MKNKGFLKNLEDSQGEKSIFLGVFQNNNIALSPLMTRNKSLPTERS